MSQSTTRNDFRRFLNELMLGDPIPWPGGEVSHAAKMAHLHQQGQVVQVDKETYWWFLEVLPPRWMSGSHFAFAEGYDRFMLFWEQLDSSDQTVGYFARQLSEAETARFCQLTGACRSH